jgi:hypothetical protein
MNLNPFNESDWDAFAGCDSKFPFISEEDFIMYGEEDFTYIGLIIVDNKTVQVHGSLDDDDEKEILLHKDFESTAEAVTYVMKLENESNVDDLISDGFKVL